MQGKETLSYAYFAVAYLEKIKIKKAKEYALKSVQLNPEYKRCSKFIEIT